MKTISFEGSSDDLIEVSINGPVQVDEEYNADTFDSFVMAAFVVAGTGGGMRVYAVYGRGGTWTFAAGRLDEGVPLPDWPSPSAPGATRWATPASASS